MRLSNEIITEIGTHLASGNYAKDIIDHLNISEPIFYKWKKEGKELENNIAEDKIKENDLTEYQTLELKFFKCLKKNSSTAILRNVNIIQKAAITQWQAAAWFLERRNYRDWGRKDKQEVQLSGESKIEHIIKFDNED